jgi:hypothetical protein
MAPIITTTEIDRPATEVFQYATDPTRFSQWQQGVVDGRLDHAGTPHVGDRCLTTRRISGANRETTPDSPTSIHPAPGVSAAPTGRSAPPSISP